MNNLLTNEGLLAGNKAIAALVGISCREIPIDHFESSYSMVDALGKRIEGFWAYTEAKYAEDAFYRDAKYHISWDWFMPAFKILKQTIARIDRNINQVGRVDEYELEIHFAVQAFNLPKAYRNLVEGAKWCLEHKDLIKPEGKPLQEPPKA